MINIVVIFLSLVTGLGNVLIFSGGLYRIEANSLKYFLECCESMKLESSRRGVISEYSVKK